MKSFNQLVSWCIPDDLREDPNDGRNARFLVSSALMLGISLPIYALVNFSIGYQVGGYITLVLLIFLTASLMLLRLTTSLALAANLLSLATIVGISLIVISSGGIRSSVTPFYVLAMLTIIWVLKKEWVYVWFGVTLLVVISIIIYDWQTDRLPLYYEAKYTTIFAGVNFVGIIVHLFLVVFNYRVTQDRALGNVRQMNASLVEKQEALRLANEELREQHLNVQSAYSALKYTSDKINEQKEEILIKSRELQAANHKISQINASLNKIVEKRTQQLRKTNEELDQFLYRSSHDLRRPLTTILGLKHVAELTFKDRAILELFDKVTDTARNMDKMLAKLITVSDINKTSLRAARINFGELIDRMKDRFGRQLGESEVDLQLKLAPKVDFRAPERLVEIVVEQLIENSLNFVSIDNAIQRFIRLEVSTQNSRGILRIVDNGIGIDPALKGQIFEMYFKGTERSQGNGLGLYVAQKAGQKMMGSIDYVDDLPGVTVFELVVPMAVVV